jgi:rhodanese-related sulfurtransferase
MDDEASGGPEKKEVSSAERINVKDKKKNMRHFRMNSFFRILPNSFFKNIYYEFKFFFMKIRGFFSRITFFLVRKRMTFGGKKYTEFDKYIPAEILLSSKENYCIVDIRSRDDFFKDHIVLERKGISMNIPFEEFSRKFGQIERFRHRKILICGDDIKQSEAICSVLTSKGFSVSILVGGYKAYRQAMYGM